MATHRLQRVRELLKRAVGEAIRRELPVDQAGVITVNDVEVSPDLRRARIFVSILGNATQQKTGLAMLGRQRVRLQGMVAKTVVLKNTPQLRFVMDSSVERGDRVLQLIEDMERPEPEA
jgi:ribosome-binding factor A